jgi:hypothetical protein
VLHTLAEMVGWMHKYVKPAPAEPKATAAAKQ